MKRLLSRYVFKPGDRGTSLKTQQSFPTGTFAVELIINVLITLVAAYPEGDFLIIIPSVLERTTPLRKINELGEWLQLIHGQLSKFCRHLNECVSQSLVGTLLQLLRLLSGMTRRLLDNAMRSLEWEEQPLVSYPDNLHNNRIRYFNEILAAVKTKWTEVIRTTISSVASMDFPATVCKKHSLVEAHLQLIDAILSNRLVSEDSQQSIVQACWSIESISNTSLMGSHVSIALLTTLLERSTNERQHFQKVVSVFSTTLNSIFSDGDMLDLPFQFNHNDDGGSGGSSSSSSGSSSSSDDVEYFLGLHLFGVWCLQHVLPIPQLSTSTSTTTTSYVMQNPFITILNLRRFSDSFDAFLHATLSSPDRTTTSPVPLPLPTLLLPEDNCDREIVNEKLLSMAHWHSMYDPFMLPSSMPLDHNEAAFIALRNSFFPSERQIITNSKLTSNGEMEIDHVTSLLINVSAAAVNSIVLKIRNALNCIDNIKQKVFPFTKSSGSGGGPMSCNDDSLAAAQLLPVMILTAYCAVASNFAAVICSIIDNKSSCSIHQIMSALIAVKAQNSTVTVNKIIETFESCVERLTDLLSHCLSELQSRIHALSGFSMVEYVSAVVKSIFPLMPIIAAMESGHCLLDRARVASIIGSILKTLQLRGIAGTTEASRKGSVIAFNDPEPPTDTALPARVTAASSKQKRDNKQLTQSDDSDDFMDVPAKKVRKTNKPDNAHLLVDEDTHSSASYYEARSRDNTYARVHFSKEYLRIYSLLTQLLSAFKAPAITDGSDSLDAVALLSVAPRGANVLRNVDHYIALAEAFADIEQYTDVQLCLSAVPWMKEYGALGYFRVLLIIFSMTKKLSFWAPANEDLQSYFLGIVFQEDDKPVPQRRYLMFWQNKMLQIKCAANYMLYGDITEKKAEIQTLFMDCIADVDVRVRLTAANELPLLLRQFKNKGKVYSAIVAATEVVVCRKTVAPRDSHRSDGGEAYMEDSFYDEADTIAAKGRSTSSKTGGDDDDDDDDDPLVLVTTAVAIAQMGTGSDLLTKRALLDLMRICSSRIKHSNQSLLHLKTLLFRLVRFSALSRGYSQLQLLIIDHFRWILSYWLTEEDLQDSTHQANIVHHSQSSTADTATALRSSPFLTIDDFPFELASQCTTLAEFLQHHSPVIVPLICAIHCARRRWAVMLQFTTAAGYSGTDNDVALVLKHSLCYLKAAEIMMAVNPQQNKTRAVDFGTFLSRNLNTADIQSCVTSYTSDTIQAIVSYSCYEACDSSEAVSSTPSSGSGSSSGTGVGDHDLLLSRPLTEVCRVLGLKTIENLLSQCNMLEIFSYLRTRLLETKLSSVKSSIALTFKTLAINLPRNISKVVLHTALNMSALVVNTCPVHIADIALVLRKLVSDLCLLTYDLKSAEQRAFSNIFSHIFSELLSLNSVVQFLLLKSETAVDDLEEFVRSYFGGLLNCRGTVADVDAFTVSLQQTQLHLKTAILEMVSFCEKNSLSTLLQPVLPLPNSFRAIHTPLIQQLDGCMGGSGGGRGGGGVGKGNKMRTSDEDGDGEEFFRARLKYFIISASAILCGEFVPLSLVWIQVVITITMHACMHAYCIGHNISIFCLFKIHYFMHYLIRLRELVDNIV